VDVPGGVGVLRQHDLRHGDGRRAYGFIVHRPSTVDLSPSSAQ
jgi:hypothetical protein